MPLRLQENTFASLLVQPGLSGPYRRPDWRYRVTRALVASGKLLSPRVTDATLRAMADYYTQRPRCRTPHDWRRLKNRMPEVVAAVNVHEATPSDLRHVTEAMILADAKVYRIAERLGCTNETVHFYEAAFFDIRGRLGRRDFVLSVIGRPAADDDLAHETWAMKAFCYLAGVQALEIFRLAKQEPQVWQRPERLLGMLTRRAEALEHLRVAASLGGAGRSDAGALEMLQKIEERWAHYWSDKPWFTTKGERLKAYLHEVSRMP